MFMSSKGAERADTHGHTHRHTLIWPESPGWRLRRGNSGVGGCRASVHESNHSLWSKMGWHRLVAASQLYNCPVWSTTPAFRGAPTISLEAQPWHTQDGVSQDGGGTGHFGLQGEVRLFSWHLALMRLFKNQGPSLTQKCWRTVLAFCLCVYVCVYVNICIFMYTNDLSFF